MKEIFLTIKRILSSLSSAIAEYYFDPIEKWMDRVTTLNVLRAQFSAATSSSYADAIVPVIEKLSAGDFELKQDLWLVAIGLVSRGVNTVDILIEFDQAAYGDDGSVIDLLLYLPVK